MERLGARAESSYERWYVEQLSSSVTSLGAVHEFPRLGLEIEDLKQTLLNHLCQWSTYTKRIFATLDTQICNGLIEDQSSPQGEFRTKVIRAVVDSSQCPRISPILFLEQLAKDRWSQLRVDWQKFFVLYGCAIAKSRWAKRLLRFTDAHDDLSRELVNSGHTNWNPFDFPESLLLEIENDIYVREVQEDIAKRMANSPPGENVVMQLNMGEGKSSVIIPMVVTRLATQLSVVRVVVAKPQSRQMCEMLVSKLGGLLNRRVYHMPISRSLKLDQVGADEIGRICRDCMLNGGVLLVQPEHILSLKLMCLESFIIGNPAVGQSLLRTLNIFDAMSCDVVDESDENFNVKFELIYTMGLQRPVELSPHRWTLIQQLLGIVRQFSKIVKQELPRSIEVFEQKAGGFPRIRLLNRDAEERLFNLVLTQICDNGLDSLPISRQPMKVRNAVRAYALNPTPTDDEVAIVEDDSPAGFWTESNRSPLLLLRGLFAGGVLGFCLSQKRWRVNYEPDSNRTPQTKLCVPYRAKDNPSPRSEFSHPDVIIILTCLVYYYAGLDDEDLFLVFNHLVQSDQACIVYQLWVDDSPMLPREYRQLLSLNLEDRNHCTSQIFPAFRFSKATIDYFLEKFVFPREMKEFPSKLSASGWDLGKLKQMPTVGFSGTNDSRKTLPLSVKQLDLPKQNHTNALVLEYLLRPENGVALISCQRDPCKTDAQQLLEFVMSLSPPAQVILDVGAQILELSNCEVATQWLEMIAKDSPIQAVVFVNAQDVICVIDRKGRVESLQTSPFARQLDVCFIFLDEAHTRGN
ncbi:hypothetical protein N7454_007282 [Penicillium verhagenii]|nr:hypothetical protein N7454_007282 [Penicillium verhagenii]